MHDDTDTQIPQIRSRVTVEAERRSTETGPERRNRDEVDEYYFSKLSPGRENISGRIAGDINDDEVERGAVNLKSIRLVIE